jgi:hypothetical protein
MRGVTARRWQGSMGRWFIRYTKPAGLSRGLWGANLFVSMRSHPCGESKPVNPVYTFPSNLVSRVGLGLRAAVWAKEHAVGTKNASTRIWGQ